jgi:hypothetical protein
MTNHDLADSGLCSSCLSDERNFGTERSALLDSFPLSTWLNLFATFDALNFSLSTLASKSLLESDRHDCG